MKIAFLLTHVPDPRMNKRIKELKKENQVTVLIFGIQFLQILNILY